MWFTRLIVFCLLVLSVTSVCAQSQYNATTPPQLPGTEEPAKPDEQQAPKESEEEPTESKLDESQSLSARQEIDLGKTPDDIPSQLNESKREDIDSFFPIGPLEPLHRRWTAGTDSLYDNYQLDLGLNYTSLYQRTSDGIRNPLEGCGGDVDFFGSWLLLGSEDNRPGSLVFSAEARHRYSKIAPNTLGDNIGSLWGTTVSFNTQDFSLVQLYWQRGTYKDGLAYRAGRIDPALIYDGGRFVSSNYAFLSPGFSDTAPMPLPGSGFGFAGAVYPTETTYLLGGVHDANGSNTRSGFDTFFEDGEFFSAIEFGAVPNEGKVGQGLYHMTFWYTDPRKEMGRPSDWGLALTLEQEFGPKGNFVPFLRYAWANRGVTGIRQNLSVGFGLEDVFGQNYDLIGAGFSWAEPQDQTLRDQYTMEFFYRIVVTPHTHITPDIQIILNPSMAPDEDSLIVFGLRVRTLF